MTTWFVKQVLRRQPLYAASVLLSLVVLTWQGLAGDVPQTDGLAAGKAPQERYREGSRVADQLGHFKPTGDRLTFYFQDEERRLLCLENLNLERIGRMVHDSPDTLVFRVTGTVTEYQGANYLLVTQATQIAKPALPAAP